MSERGVTNGDDERCGRPVRALGDGRGERAAVCLIGAAMFGLALIGMYVSFQTVYEYVHPWFGGTAWAVPVAIDVAILVFSAADLLLSYWRMARPSMRLIPWGFTAATIWLNWQAGGPVPIRVAHAAMPALWVLFCEYARHVLAARVGLVNGGRMERVRRSRWLLAPLSTARLRRQMILWEITSYRRALELEAGRRAEIARLEMTHGRKWRRRAPADERLAVKLARVAPAELLPSLTATITPAAERTAAERTTAERATAERTVAERTARERAGREWGASEPAAPTSTAPLEPEPGPSSPPELPPLEPKISRIPEPNPGPSGHASVQAPRPASRQPSEQVSEQVRQASGQVSGQAGGSARQRAAALLATEPDLPGTELARRLGVTTGYGRRLRSELLNTANGYR